jgi:sec-independent protein translocase protein TatA
MNIFGIGLPEMAVIAAIGLLVFGPKRLPELGKTLGRTLRGFQSASQEFEKEFRTAITPDQASETEVVAAQVLPASDSLPPEPAIPVISDNPSLSATVETVDAVSADQPHG